MQWVRKLTSLPNAMPNAMHETPRVNWCSFSRRQIQHPTAIMIARTATAQDDETVRLCC